MLVIMAPSTTIAIIKCSTRISHVRASIQHSVSTATYMIKKKLQNDLLSRDALCYQSPSTLKLLNALCTSIKKERESLPRPRALLSAFNNSARNFSISRATEMRFFSITCFCTTCSSLAFFSNSNALLQILPGVNYI